MGNKKPGTIYSVLSNAALVGLFLSVGILIVGIMQDTLNAGMVLILSILSIIFGGCALSLVWVRNLERKRYFKTSIVFLAITVACCILWIACAIVIYNMVKSVDQGTFTDVKLAKMLNFIRISLVITVQFVFSNVITRNIIRYKKNFVAFQIIHYSSCVFVDFYISMLALAVRFKESGADIVLKSGTTEFLFNGVMLTIFIVACVYIAISNSVLQSIARKKSGGKTGKRTVLDSLFDEPEFEEDIKQEEALEVQTSQKEDKVSVKKRLNELKALYDDGIISKEEYEQKRNDILKDI